MAVNWGILGASKFAATQMAPAMQLAGNARLGGLATSDRDKAAPFLALAPDLKIYEHYDALLAAPEIDAVYVPLPNHLHIEWAEKALRAGKPVLVEKPIALTADAIAPLISLRDETGLLCTEAYMIVHHPQWQRVRAVLADGAIGPLRHVDALFTYNNAADTRNIRNNADTGGGSLPDIGVYTIGATRWATGAEPVEVTHADLTLEDGIDTTARVAARFDGFTANWLTSMRMERHQVMTFLGESGTLRLTAPFNAGSFGEARLEMITGETTRVERWPTVNQYVAQIEAFGAALDGADYVWTLEDARGTQTVIDAIHEKARA